MVQRRAHEATKQRAPVVAQFNNDALLLALKEALCRRHELGLLLEIESCPVTLPWKGRLPRFYSVAHGRNARVVSRVK